MKRAELETIGAAFAKEYYRLCKENGIPQSDLITSDEVCRITGKSKGWIYNHAGDLPHANGLYSRTAVMAYLER
jgi:hypothetical protein